MKLPPVAEQVITTLNNAGYEAYAVGGCVRDSLLNKEPHDWDIATNAAPEQIKASFYGEKTVDTGIKHGTVTVILDDTGAEITTYRIDGAYSDGRRPDTVEFTDSLRLDLSRRDFTINAMAYHPKHGLIDYFGGEQDIKFRAIRCVGDPAARFSEDALRILRAVRFSSQLGFEILEDTKRAMENLAEGLNKISPERVFSELCKTLTGKSAALAIKDNAFVIFKIIPEIELMQGFLQHSKYHDLNVFEHTLKAMENSPRDIALRMAILFHDIGKPYTFTMLDDGEGHFYGHAGKGAEIAFNTLNRLRCEGALLERAVYLVKHHHDELKPERPKIKRALNKMGKETLGQLIALKRADSSAKREKYAEEAKAQLDLVEAVLNKIIADGEAFSLKQLQINGSDLLAAGFEPGKRIGEALGILLDGVIDNRIENERGELLKEAGKILRL